MKTAGVTREVTSVTLKSAFETNKSLFRIQLMIVYVFQHKSDIFRLIDVINGVIFYFQTNFFRHYKKRHTPTTYRILELCTTLVSG